MWTAANLGWHQTLLVLLFCWSSCRAVLVNRFIDDSLGDSVTGFKPIYNPPGSWADQTCSSCPIQPDRSLAYAGTWTAATYTPQVQNLSITLQFTGTQILVYFILPNANQHGTSVTTNTYVDFTMDGTYICNYTHTPDMSTYNMNYNTTVFNMIGLGNTPHQLVISTHNVPYNSYLNFDYAMYTTETSQTTDSSNTVPLSSTLNPSSSSVAPGSAPTATQSGTTPNSLPPPPPIVFPGNQGNNQDSTSSFSSSSSSSSSTSTSTSSSSSSSSSSSPPVTVIVGGVFGAFAVIIIACLSFLLLRIKKSKELASIKSTTLGSPSRATSNDNETGSHLPWQNTVFSETPEPLGDLPVGLAAGVAAGTDSGSPTLAYSHSRSASDYTSAPTPTPALLPIGTPLPVDREKLRAIRQTEIDEQLNSAQREMENLAARQSMPPPPPPNAAERPAPTDQAMEALREQVRMLSGQIEHLHRERQSDWALGLSDEAPPAYAR
ncbi:hypothetical protein JOM56_003207 [Amanita muscaria]